MNKIVIDENGAAFVDEAGKEVRRISWEHLREYCFNDEFVEVDGTMQSVIEECEEFSNSHNMIALIIDMLKSKYNEAKGLVEADDFKNTVKDTLDRSTMLFKNMNSSYDQFMDYCSNVPPEVNSITTTPGTYLKHSMFEFKNVLDQLVYEVSLVPSNESA